jgi:hypothetical protein
MVDFRREAKERGSTILESDSLLLLTDLSRYKSLLHCEVNIRLPLLGSLMLETLMLS